MGRWVFLILILALPASGSAQRNLGVGAGEQRTALVIGNGAYTDAPLRNPTNDATDVAAVLKGLGFNVLLRTNANRRQTIEAVREFGNQLRRGGAGFFYYAGHGVQSRGRNFLIPVGAHIASEADIEFEAVDANSVLAQMDDAGNRVNIVVLDACRDNPFARSFRSAARGLAQMDSAKGSFIAYATSPGSVAADGSGRNGTYTKHLLDSLKQPDSKLEEVFKRVRLGVAKETGSRQIPWDSSSVLGDFYFNAAELAVGQAPAGSQPAAAAERSGGSAFAVELEFWQAARESNDPAQLRAYLSRFPTGEFVPLARLRLESGPSAGTTPAPVRAVMPLIDPLPEAAFRASSIWSNDERGHGPANARFSTTDATSNWSADRNDPRQWLQVDLQRVSTVRAIGTKGRHPTGLCTFFGGCQQWVTAYYLSYSLDGADWQYLEEGGKPVLLAGNIDYATEVRIDLKAAIRARFLRFHPHRWNDHITMRVEAYGFTEQPGSKP